jgi:hypothetical protein
MYKHHVSGGQPIAVYSACRELATEIHGDKEHRRVELEQNGQHQAERNQDNGCEEILRQVHERQRCKQHPRMARE